MRIAIEASWAQGRVTGVGYYIRALLKQLAQLAPEHEYFLLHFSREWTGPDFGPQFTPVSYRLGTAVSSIGLRLNGVLRRLDVDLFHATNATGVPPRPSVPVVTTVHDLYRYHRDAATLWYRDVVFKYLFRWSRRYSSHFITNSQFTADELTQIAGVLPSRITPIHLGVEPAPGGLTDETGTDGYVLCLGAIEDRKGQLFLLEVYRAALADNPNLPQLVFVGPDRGDGAALQARLEDVSLAGKVRWIEYADGEAKERLFQDACLFAMPSRFEGFGIPLLEAMVRRVPTLASDIPVFREIAPCGAALVSGWDVGRWKQQLLGLLADAAGRATLAAAGQEQARAFTWERCARKTLECYEQIGGK